MFSGTEQFSHQICQFFVSSVCLLLRVIMVDKNKAVVCCLLATSAVMFYVSQSSGNNLYISMNARVASVLLILDC